MADVFSNYTDSIDAPASNAVAITPHDSTDLSNTTRGVFVGVGGVVVAVVNGAAVTFTGAASGSILPIRCTRINSTSTTATNMVALW